MEPTPPALDPPIRTLLRLEGAAALALAIGAYSTLGYGWILFAALLLLPDLSMLGYIAGPQVGALAYNFAHSYITPVAIGAAAWFSGSEPAVAAALIWTAHIGMDRMLGYGLKLPTGFRNTHLGQIGRS